MYLGQRYIHSLIQHSGESLSKRSAWPTEEFQVSQGYTEETLTEKGTNKQTMDLSQFLNRHALKGHWPELGHMLLQSCFAAVS